MAARYLIPALVDCLGRLSIASASNPHPPALAQTPGLSRAPPSVPALNATASATPLNDHDPPTRGVTDARERDERLQDDCAGDPASRALFHYCSNRDGTAGDPDLGIGKGESFLVLSRALGEMCLQVGRGLVRDVCCRQRENETRQVSCRVESKRSEHCCCAFRWLIG